MKKNNRSLHLLKVTPKDEKLLFTWANEKLVRKWSFHNLPISRLDHNNWFRKNLKNKKLHMWKLKFNSSFCGLIRIENVRKNFKLSYQISSNFRGRGLGAKMINIAIRKLRKKIPKAVIYANSFSQNISSHKTLINSGFKVREKKGKVINYINKNN